MRTVYVKFEVEADSDQDAEAQVKENMKQLHEAALHLRVDTKIIETFKFANRAKI